jgi:serine/threonine protein phosphatase PrpC
VMTHKFRKDHLASFQEWMFAVADGHGTAGHQVS